LQDAFLFDLFSVSEIRVWRWWEVLIAHWLTERLSGQAIFQLLSLFHRDKKIAGPGMPEMPVYQ